MFQRCIWFIAADANPLLLRGVVMPSPTQHVVLRRTVCQHHPAASFRLNFVRQMRGINKHLK